MITPMPQLLGEREAAAYLGMDIESLKRLRRNRKISHFRVGAQNNRYRIEDLNEYIPEPNEKRIYVIPAREFVKIGIAKNPAERWKDLRCGNPFLEPLAFTSEPIRNSARFEKEVHRELREFQHNASTVGQEWFQCSTETAVVAIRKVFAQWEDFKRFIESVR